MLLVENIPSLHFVLSQQKSCNTIQTNAHKKALITYLKISNLLFHLNTENQKIA